jgi:hypothetical protein
MDDIFELAVRLVSAIARFVAIVAELLSSIVFEYFVWGLGWITCRVYTAGSYPSERISEYEKADTTTSIVVGVSGLVHLAVMVILLSKII